MNEIIILLESISAGEALKWIIIIIGLIGSFSVLVAKGFDKFEEWCKRKNIKENHENQIAKSEKQINQLMVSIEEISTMVKNLRTESIERDKIQIRHTIVTSCNNAIEHKGIDSSELQALEDLYSLYTSEPINGNSYATTLIIKVRKLPIVPKGLITHEN